MRRRSGRPYVHEGGILSRGGDPSSRGSSSGVRSQRASLSRFVEWDRVAWILIPALVLFVTNPANGILPCYLSYSSSDWIGRPGVTNYGILSLEHSIEGVAVVGLLTRSDVICPFYDPVIGSFCGSLADSMCHRKPFFPWEYPPWGQYFRELRIHGFGGFGDLMDTTGDFLAALASDRVHVVHRCICALLVGSALWKYCCPWFPSWRYLLSDGSNELLLPLRVFNDLWDSVFFRSTATTNLFRDLFYQNIFVYPALVEVNRIVPKLRMTSWLVRPTGNETADYVVAVVLLVVFCGGGSNRLASRIVGGGRSMVGFSTVGAVGLGYLVRSAGRSTILATFRRHDVGYAHAFWSQVAWIVIGNPDDWYPHLVVWIVAGLAGAVYAEFHFEHVAVFDFRDLLGFFGLA